MFCKHCGRKVEDGATFCSGCGARLGGGAQAAGAAVPPNSPTAPGAAHAAVVESSPKESRVTRLWAIIVVVFLALVAVLLLTQCSKGIERTWYQENDYYGYSATLTIGNGTYVMVMDGNASNGTAQVSGNTCVLDGEFEYALSADGRTLTCTNNSGTNMYAGEWFTTRDDAAKFPRRQ